MKPRTTQTPDTSASRLAAIDVGILAELFDQAPDVAFFVKDDAGRYVTVNESLAKRHGLTSKGDAIGKRPRDICPGEFGRLPTEQDAKVLRSGRPIVDQLEMQWHAPHDPVWCLTTKLPVFGNHGDVVGIIGFSRDLRQTVEPHEVPPAFAEALKEFELDLASDTTPATLADRSGLSQPRLARLMKRLFGLTPRQFITKTRIATASRLLRETDQSIADISFACGFYDHSAFTRAFRVSTGVTPTEYRKVHG
ncbi:MAG: AraC family transcriptional regulator [Planctomycetaceae bacterium]